MPRPTIQQNIDLYAFNTFGIRAVTQYFSAIDSPDQLQLLLQAPECQALPKLVLGGGSNILFTQDYAGLVVKNEIRGIQCIGEDEEHVFLKVGAGENWHELVLYCIANNYAGIENLSLIPGTVGAAPIQNIGAYGVELKDVFHELEAVNYTGTLKTFTNTECRFGYRDSIFKAKTNEYIIANVTLRLQKKPIFNVNYGTLLQALKAMNHKELTIKAISDAVIEIRRSKLPDPRVVGNAGSFFKNPLISKELFVQIQKNFSDVPYFPEKNSDSVKIPAGWLIEQCGWKGKRLGNIGIYDKQALVIVNYGAGTGAEIWQLAQQIQHSVFEKFGIQLVPEVNVL
jgi:UDP-N-acetylmuramate dehydrogenase